MYKLKIIILVVHINDFKNKYSEDTRFLLK